MLRGAAINRATSTPPQVPRHVRRHPQIPVLFHKPEGVELFVVAHCQRMCAGKPLHHHQRRIAFRRSVGLEDLRVYDQSVPVLHQQIPAVAQPEPLPFAFARQQRVGIGLGPHRFRSSASPRESSPWGCQDHPAEPSACPP
jgi:hypothetical protein